MAVKIRLARHGGKKSPFYRIVVANVESPRDGRFIEQVGVYDPGRSPTLIQFRAEKLAAWLKKGARPTQTVAQLIRFVFADELRHGLGGPRSLLEPGGQLLGPELDQGGGAAGIVHADLLDEAPVARRLRVGDHDTVEGAFLAAVAGEADLDCHAVLLPEGQRGRPGSPGILGIIGPEPSCFNTFFVCVNCLISRFTSATDVPLPLAMRFRRLAFRSWTFLRSARVIELMIASTRFNSSSAPERSAPRSIFFTPGIMPMSSLTAPIFLTARSCSRKSSRSNAFRRSFFCSTSACERS